MPDVVLHIGAMKTGTSYIQRVFSTNRDALAAQGVMWAGDEWAAQLEAVEQLMVLRKDPHAPLDLWRQFAASCSTYSGRTAAISMEFLSFANDAVVQEVVTAFRPHRVKVVISLRDLARVLPAQWQELTQNGRDWTYREYLDGATANKPTETKPTENKPGQHFWFRQDWLRILDTWRGWVDARDVVVVTVPPAGAPPRLLMERMCEACEIDPAPLAADAVGVFGNDSLGAVSAELMRRVTHEALELKLPRRPMDVLKFDVAKFCLSGRRQREPSIVLPRKYHSWVDKKSQQLVRELKQLSPPVIGDLNELIPTWPDFAGRNVTDDPQNASAEDVLEAALDGLFALSRRRS